MSNCVFSSKIQCAHRSQTNEIYHPVHQSLHFDVHFLVPLFFDLVKVFFGILIDNGLIRVVRATKVGGGEGGGARYICLGWFSHNETGGVSLSCQ